MGRLDFIPEDKVFKLLIVYQRKAFLPRTTHTLASGHCRDMKIHNTLLPNKAAVANSSAPAHYHVKHVVKLFPLDNQGIET